MPAPVAPPPTTSTSVFRVVMPYSVWHGLLLGLEPVEGPRHGLLPELVVLVALAGVHRGLPALVLLPVLAQVLLLRPESGRQAGRVGGAERRRLRHLRADHRHAEQVGLELHEQLVLDHAAV